MAGGPRGCRMGCSPARAAPGPNVPVMGVGGKALRWEPKVAALAVFGPSATPPNAEMAREEAFLWPRRKAVADGGGSGST